MEGGLIEEIRDIVIIAGLIVLAGIAVVFALIVGYAGYRTLRIVRRVRRFHDGEVQDGLERAHDQMVQWREDRVWELGGMARLPLTLLRLTRARRKPKKKKRFAFLRR